MVKLPDYQRSLVSLLIQFSPLSCQKPKLSDSIIYWPIMLHDQLSHSYKSNIPLLTHTCTCTHNLLFKKIIVPNLFTTHTHSSYTCTCIQACRGPLHVNLLVHYYLYMYSIVTQSFLQYCGHLQGHEFHYNVVLVHFHTSSTSLTVVAAP